MIIVQPKKKHKQTCDFVGIKYSKLRNYLKSTNLDNTFSLQKTLNASCTSLKGKGTAYNHAVTVLHEARRWVDWFINDCTQSGILIQGKVCEKKHFQIVLFSNCSLSVN